MARRRSRRRKEETATQETQATARITTTKRTRRRTYKRKEFDAHAWLEKNVDEFVQQVGLDMLGLERSELIEILSKIVEELAGSSTYVSLDTMVRRFRRFYDRLAPIIAASIVEMKQELTRDQLEFVASNIGEYILMVAPKLYREVLRHGAHDLIPILQQHWIKAWISRRGAPIPPKCPKCGFNSLMPDLTCLVCGSAINDRELRSSEEFRSMFREFIKRASREELEYTLKAGYVLLSAYSIKSPRDERSRIDIEVFLSPEEKEEIRRALEQSKGQ